MREKLLIHLTDLEVTLYNEACEKLFQSEGEFEKAGENLSHFLKAFPKFSLHFLIDTKGQYVHEETLPPLYPWERAQYLFHKKKGWKSPKSFSGYQFLRQDGISYFRWIHIPHGDPLTPWLLWFLERPQKGGSLFFVPFEIGFFLDEKISSAAPYRLLLYPINEKDSRYVIFKDKRFLLSRTFHTKADVKASLHFLSRRFPDIYEGLHVYTLTDQMPLSQPNVIKLDNEKSVLKYFFSRKRPSMGIEQPFHLKKTWIKKGSLMAFAILTGIDTALLYETYAYEEASIKLLSQAEKTKFRLKTLQKILKDKDILHLQKAIDDYHDLKSKRTYSYKVLEKLFCLFRTNSLRLEKLNIKQNQELEITLDLSIANTSFENLVAQFDKFLVTCKYIFPHAEIKVIEAPFNSAPHETLKRTSLTQNRPPAKIRLYIP
ncbi:MAG: hypothetical protein ACD_16C00132G0005 [uncultured bacterium]|nr:MAG: hypothetical protein ACD_16C00132G0005 [uncultured bacterium]OFW69554.1 MAG: hypothetical protein A2X70_00870 [Alphaproteobacteria bacterium GWC2_42_16]OFW74078.1 MAG: hypothetical protein A2Z80_04535 [Alphaproteobacteria bacterium GWA2_41_27]OFW84386.1 MAG: hypothetical protein A3E50_03220 [Alphaproteobacteria bacterium RIFCSPHIGHO2_12_FULL_42_100]OFW85907.1 MAG: hypothetical protein A2W06_05100 [Alphaproteobacteria bacterium RBG_16_42_14]OFW92232.1 MAG: hypothetical protein A3C41_028